MSFDLLFAGIQQMVMEKYDYTFNLIQCYINDDLMIYKNWMNPHKIIKTEKHQSFGNVQVLYKMFPEHHQEIEDFWMKINRKYHKLEQSL